MALDKEKQQQQEEEEDDYMNMTFTDPEPSGPLSSIARKQLERERAAIRGRPKSKKELEAEAEAKRTAALSTSLDQSNNKGARLMAKLGYKGGALGKTENARTQPIQVTIKEDRGGIGADSEKKRKVREYMEAVQGREKMQKADENDFRERNRRERELKRNEGMMWAAMRIAEKFDTEADEDVGEKQGEEQRSGTEDVTKDASTQDGKTSENKDSGGSSSSSSKPGNLLWRSLVKQRADRDRDRKMRQSALSRRQENDEEEDADDKIALGTSIEEVDFEDQEEEKEDAELDAFTALDPADRLAQIVEYLRKTYNYCFWCKYRYPDADLEGCPGTTEEEHD